MWRLWGAVGATWRDLHRQRLHGDVRVQRRRTRVQRPLAERVWRVYVALEYAGDRMYGRRLRRNLRLQRYHARVRGSLAERMRRLCGGPRGSGSGMRGHRRVLGNLRLQRHDRDVHGVPIARWVPTIARHMRSEQLFLRLPPRRYDVRNGERVQRVFRR
jgi:hypothetical protein